MCSIAVYLQRKHDLTWLDLVKKTFIIDKQKPTTTYKNSSCSKILCKELALSKNKLSKFHFFTICRKIQGRIQGGQSPHRKPKKVTLFTMILHNSENNICDIRPFCRPLLCHSSVVKYCILHLSCSSERVMILDYQILLKSPPPLNLLPGYAPGKIYNYHDGSHDIRSKYNFFQFIQGMQSVTETTHNNVINQVICQAILISQLDFFW